MWGPKRSSGYQSKAEIDWLIAVLGNPGSEYENTPHNAGFGVGELLVSEHRLPLREKYQGRYGTGTIDEHDVAVVFPLTYMNLSGQSVKPAFKALGLQPRQLIVVHDEVELPFGRIRIKEGGGHGGHNGLRSITDLLGSRDFVRVRLGVGRQPAGDRRPLADWLLAPFDTVCDTDGLYRSGARAVEEIITRGTSAAVKSINAVD